MFMITLLLMLACGGTPASAPDASTADKTTDKTADLTPVSVITATAAESQMPIFVPLAGSIVASQQVQVAADTNGVVQSISVERGSGSAKARFLRPLIRAAWF